MLRSLKRLLVDLPTSLRLAYCLMRDDRVPLATKAAFGGGFGVLLAPRPRLPRSLPLLGELDAIAVLLLALRLFIAACPDEVVLDVEQAIIEQRSVFDEDVRRGERMALSILHRVRPNGAGADAA
jgi:uncharacterized membrane protein YkvA (DUF1232 family)